MAEKIPNSFNKFSTSEAELRLGDVMKNNVKMAAMLRRVFPSKFLNSHYMGLVQEGKLDGSIINVAPSTYQVICGEQPIQGVAGVFYAENGDIIIGAPNGRIRIFARDIDLYASGNGTDTGWVNINANAKVDIDGGGAVNLHASDSVGIECERDLNLNASGKCEVNAGDFKIIEGPDVSPITSPLGSGSNTILQTAKGLIKLIESLTP